MTIIELRQFNILRYFFSTPNGSYVGKLTKNHSFTWGDKSFLDI